MPKFSARIISPKLGAKLGACLERLSPVVGEGVVVVSGSAQGTLQIARRFTGRAVQQEGLGPGQQEAHAYGLACHGWILNRDCDERLTPEQAASTSGVRVWRASPTT